MPRIATGGFIHVANKGALSSLVKKGIVGGYSSTFQIKVVLKNEKAGTLALQILTRRISESRPLPLLAVFSRWGLSPAVAALHPASGRLSATVRGFLSTFFRGSPLPVDFSSAASAGFHPRHSFKELNFYK
jgi:hypothetical protein